MKFLVLALALCTANAASYYGNYGSQNKPYKSQAPSRYPVASAQAIVSAPATKVAPVPEPVVPAPAVREPTYVPKNKGEEVEILENVNEQTPEGGFVAKFATSDGTYVEAVGTKKVVGDAVVLVHKGSYRYYTKDGEEVIVNYEADENGYVAESPYLPVAPPVPAEIAASIEYIARNVKYVESSKQ